MLYERWRQIVQQHRNELALHDLAADERLTFAELDSAVEVSDRSEEKVLFPRGINAEFVLTVLRAWKAGQVVCPLEVEQTTPIFSRLPLGCVHLKSTSATTGAPRVVAFRAAQLMADAENIVTTMGLRPDWPNLGLISLAHSYGFSNLVLPLLLHGIPLILVNSRLPEVLRHALSIWPDVTLSGVPALWRVWHDAGAISLIFTRKNRD